jgi:hypothetical protein
MRLPSRRLERPTTGGTEIIFPDGSKVVVQEQLPDLLAAVQSALANAR